MIRSDLVRMYRDIHRWVGIVCGLFLFIAFYAGAIAMFEIPIQRWASPPVAESSITPLEKTPELIQKLVEAYPEAAQSLWIMMNPGPEVPSRILWEVRDTSGHGASLFYANLDGEGELQVLENGPSPVAQMVDELHQQVGLLLPHEVAMPITGIVALLYGVALISGIIILLPTLVKDLFAVRLGKKLKRMWLDVHNLLGVFSLPFHLVMALTAVVFALHDQFYASQHVLIKPALVQSEKVVDTARQSPVKPEAITPQQALAEVISIKALVQTLKKQAPGFEPQFFNYRVSPTGEVQLRVDGVNERHHVRGPRHGSVLLSPDDGKIVATDYMPGMQGVWGATVTSFFALHFGSYGGETIRWSYFILGLAGAFLFYSGNLLWIEGRRRKVRKGAQTEDVVLDPASRFMGSLTVGVSLGCICGISLSIAAAKLLANWFDVSSETFFASLYYLLFSAALMIAWRRGAAQASVDLLFIAALCTALIPLASLLSLVFDGVGWNHSDGTIGVDLVAMVGAGIFMWLANKRRQQMGQAPVNSVWFKTPRACDSDVSKARGNHIGVGQ